MPVIRHANLDNQDKTLYDLPHCSFNVNGDKIQEYHRYSGKQYIGYRCKAKTSKRAGMVHIHKYNKIEDMLAQEYTMKQYKNKYCICSKKKNEKYEVNTTLSSLSRAQEYKTKYIQRKLK